MRGALANLGHQVGRGAIANILKENGIEPAPERDGHTRRSTFLKAHWECLAATDFLSGNRDHCPRAEGMTKRQASRRSSVRSARVIFNNRTSTVGCGA